MSCPVFTQCEGFLGVPGYSVETSGILGNCVTTCAPQWLAWLWLLLFRWDCGKCEDFGSMVPPVNAAQLKNDVAFLASDKLMGRDNDDFAGGDGVGAQLAQEFLIQQLQVMGAVGRDNTSGPDAYWQNSTLNFYPIRNIIGILPGNDDELAGEYVVLGAHYDHVAFCRSASNADSNICNGATDNAASVASILSTGRALKELDPRRSIVLAFWDAEEDGLLGSLYFTDEDPIVPLDKIVSYINLDIMGANIVPSLRKWSFAVAPETGGNRLQGALSRAIKDEGLNTRSISSLLGQGRSDYFNFANQQVPTVFFSDSNGGCYHTTGDEIKNVDFSKLNRETRISTKLTYELAMTANPPSFETSLLPVTYKDFVTIRDVARIVRDSSDIELLPSEATREAFLEGLDRVEGIVFRGPLLFPLALLEIDDLTISVGAIVNSFIEMECDGFVQEDI